MPTLTIPQDVAGLPGRIIGTVRCESRRGGFSGDHAPVGRFFLSQPRIWDSCLRWRGVLHTTKAQNEGLRTTDRSARICRGSEIFVHERTVSGISVSGQQKMQRLSTVGVIAGTVERTCGEQTQPLLTRRTAWRFW